MQVGWHSCPKVIDLSRLHVMLNSNEKQAFVMLERNICDLKCINIAHSVLNSELGNDTENIFVSRTIYIGLVGHSYLAVA